jgi:hypothetical protein
MEAHDLIVSNWKKELGLIAQPCMSEMDLVQSIVINSPFRYHGKENPMQLLQACMNVVESLIIYANQNQSLLS